MDKLYFQYYKRTNNVFSYIFQNQNIRKYCRAAAAEQSIAKILKEKFPKALSIKVQDISGGCGAMFEVKVVCRTFQNKSLVEQHKEVSEALKSQIQLMHGIRIITASS
ncbi:BolA-like protein 3 [Trichinella patagoniensis]|uniref:BolA-like protein 3 n=1 Tax=Trichinella patagoniensis TaxID=990121 RepID=A0A0V0ZXQ7_9BILA|nr:BolA-like protein 3 [Trichinella patagoniensis]